MDNKTLFRWHGWLGLNLGLLLFVVCFSGTVAVFSYEIDWLVDPDVQVALDPAAPPVDWTAIQDGVREVLPYHEIIFLSGPRHEGFAATAIATGPAGRNEKVYVHPQTGEVQRVGSFWNVQRFFRSFHRRMFFPNPFGILWVGFFALVLGASAITGLLFYRGWYRNLFRLRWRDARLLFSDGHRLAGVWSLAFAVVIVVTGVWYVVELAAPADGPGVPDAAPEKVAVRGPTPQMLPMEEQIRIAQVAFPGFEVVDVWPGTPTRATELRGQADAWAVRPRANRVRVDAVTGDVRLVQDATEVPLYQRWSDTADPLHFGTFGGLTTQVLWFLFGLLTSGLMLSGGWLWHLRAEQKARAAGAGRHPRWSYVAAAVPVVVLLASTVFGVLEVQKYTQPDAPTAWRVADDRVGPWTAHLVQLGPAMAGAATTFKVYLFAEDGTPNPAGGTVSLACDGCGGDDASLDRAGALDGLNPLEARVDVPASTSDVRVSVALREPSGATHVLDAPLVTSDRAASPTSASVVRVDDGPTPIPVAVWLVIGVFVVLTLGIVSVWLVLAQRTAARRASTSASESNASKPSPSASNESARAVAVSADLPTSG